MGCPIQTFTDQRLLSSPRDFSQSATSFFASYRQGIHQMPLTFLDYYVHVKSYQFNILLFFSKIYALIFALYPAYKISSISVYFVKLKTTLNTHSLYVFNMHFLFTSSNNLHLASQQDVKLFSIPVQHLSSPPLLLVEVNGIEPLTYALQTRRSPSWAIPPSLL